MKDVSCRFFETPLKDLRERGIDAALLCAGTPYTAQHLARKDERVEWSALVVMMENARELWTPAQLLALGEQSTKGLLVQFIGVIARLRFSVRGFFEWVTAPDGIGQQMITCVDVTTRATGPAQLSIDVAMKPGFAVSEPFFLITQGTYAALPRMVGAPVATVHSTPTPRGVHFVVDYVEPKGVITSVRRAISWPFTVRQAGIQLADAHGSLLARYRELDATRGEVERQRERLDIAYRLGQQIWRSQDPAFIGAAVLDVLLGMPHVTGARFTVTAHEIDATRGVTTGPSESAGLRDHGRIEVWSRETAEIRGLLDLVVPTIALALDNARAARELLAHQANLEHLVEQRTTELRLAVEQLREAQGARQRFFANVSHEIRTPLTLVVLAAADVETRAGALLDARARQSLGSITEAARKLLRLVDELLLLAAGQENKLAVHLEPIDLAALIAQMLAGWRPAAEAAGQALEARLVERLTATVDPVAIERVASNLVSNAMKYTPSGGRIEIELADEAGGLRLSVFDDGPGIDTELASRLFGRFERAATTGAQTIGTGIGLSLVKQLVEVHGGTVQALPRAGGGTEMRVVLPGSLKTATVATTSGPRLAARAPATSTIRSGDVFPAQGLSAGTILVAEDDVMLAERIALLLSEQYTVVVGLDGEAALALVKAHQPQLLVTDVDMPRMTGIELAAKFREETGDKLAPVIILSAVMDLGTRVAGLDAGAVDYIGKPFDPRELEARVRAQFRMRELAVRLHRAEQLSTLGILTSGLAHELRNPANGIVNAIEPMREMLPADVPKGVLVLMEVLEDCAAQVGFLSRQLLGFRGTAALELHAAHIPELVQRAVSLAQPSLASVEVRTGVPLERSVMCAPPLLVQVLTNLIENGAHAAGHGGWVQVLASHDAGRIVVEVSDSGPGVPVALRERIFEPFFTTKPQGVGTGLGLSVARAIVQRHGGVLEVRERGQRAAFVIELPDSNAA